MQAASYGIGVMAQHCAKDFRQACLGMPCAALIKFSNFPLPPDEPVTINLCIYMYMYM